MAEEDKKNGEAPVAAAEAAPDAAPEPAPAAAPVAAPEERKATPEQPEEEMPSGDESSDSEPEVEAAPAAPVISTFARLKMFLAETNAFLERFDDLVEARDEHKTVYLCTVNELREPLVTLLNRYILHTMVREDFLYKHIKCCGEDDELMNTEEFEEHYEEAHKEADSAISQPELTVIQEYARSVKEYIELGKAMNNDLIFSLKRLLRKSNTVLAGHLG